MSKQGNRVKTYKKLRELDGSRGSVEFTRDPILTDYTLGKDIMLC